MSRERAVEATGARALLNPATVIVVCALALTALGLTVLFSASAWFRTKQGVEVPYLYLTKQVTGVFVAAVVCFVTSRLNLDYVRRYAWWIAGGCALLLVLVAIPHIGVEKGGSRRWLGSAHGTRLQVSEFAKLGFAFCLAHYLALNQTRIGELKRGYLLPLGIIGGFVVLLVAEPDFGMAAFYLFVGLSMLFLAGAKWRYLIATGVLAGALMGAAVAHNPNRVRRIAEFWSEEPPYQVQQALAAYAAGGPTGTGLGQGRQQLSFLPEAHTDMIFAVIGEELGLIGTLTVLSLFVAFAVLGIRTALRAPDRFGMLVAAGVTVWIVAQAAVNIGGVIGMLPVSGIPLPFVSFGGSSLLFTMIAAGILANIARQSR